jgi:inorganic triphosphatase YgiF
MIVEAELKLRIAPEQLARLKRHALLWAHQVARPATRRLYNIYYDTPKLDLHQSGMALRLRHVGRQWLQTLKGGGKAQVGLHQRNEWETPVAGEALDFEALEASGAKPFPPAVRKKLQPVFVTDFSRTSRMLVFGGAKIELGMDSGEISTGQSTRPISELELELKSGEPVQLYKLALVLLDIVPLEVEHANKAEYGYRLFSCAKPVVVKAATPDLSECPDVPSALQAMIWSCLFHLQANVSGAAQKLDVEYLHQVRVALRRLCVVLGMAKIFRADDKLAVLNEQVSALCVELGRSREWDVFVTQALAPVHASLHKHAGLHNVLNASEKLRGQHHAKVRDALQSQDFQRLLLRFGAWMHGDYWRGSAADDGLTLSQFAVQILGKRSKQVSKRGKKLAGANTSQLHALRIACKKLRYSAELFAPLYAGAKVKRYLAALATLQDTLGMLNDIAVARRLLDELDSAARHETLILIRGWIEHDFAGRMGELREAWKRFSGQKAFWD